MQSIKTCSTTTRSNRILFVYVILADILTAFGVLSCGLYGALPCEFLPAPPGQTPKCARPGKTYCEHVDNYPIHRIKELVHKWGYEAKNLLVDETWDDFAAVAWHDTPVFYDPISIFPTRPNYAGNEPNFNGYKYETPSHSAAAVSAQIHQRYGNNRHGGGGGGGGGNAPSTTYLIQTNKLQHNGYPQQQHHHQPTDASSIPSYLLYSSAAQRFNHNEIGKTHHNNNVTPNNPTLWLKRIVRDLSERQRLVGISATNFTSSAVAAARPRLTRDVSLNMDLLDIVGVQRPTQQHQSHQSQQQRTRTKRQSPGRSTLCPTTSQFITPQAALNSKGNWMFVVNEANTARQMVKAELCTSNTCTNICELPNGYNSRCEQKFVQKRLIALQGNGQNLYTDTFWFPSCCVCTIAAN